MEKNYTIDEVCAHLNVSKSTVYLWVRTRNLPAMRVGLKLLFPAKKLEQWIQENATRRKATSSQEKGEHDHEH